MTSLSRECVVCERMLLEARAALSGVGYARWQVDRIAKCDSYLRDLDRLRGDFEALRRAYDEARDYHRAARGRLRRDYYSFIKVASIAPDAAEGIEAKASALMATLSPSGLGEAKARVGKVLTECTNSHVIEQERCDAYCRVHNELRLLVIDCKRTAKECYTLAMRAIRDERRNKRQLALQRKR